jgi:hypothetical protein
MNYDSGKKSILLSFVIIEIEYNVDRESSEPQKSQFMFWQQWLGKYRVTLFMGPDHRGEAVTTSLGWHYAAGELLGNFA